MTVRRAVLPRSFALTPPTTAVVRTKLSEILAILSPITAPETAAPASTSSGKRKTDSKIKPIITPKTNREANMEGVWPEFSDFSIVGVDIPHYFLLLITGFFIFFPEGFYWPTHTYYTQKARRAHRLYVQSSTYTNVQYSFSWCCFFLSTYVLPSNSTDSSGQ